MATTISIVIPCYNQARYLQDAIDSVLAQMRPADEIIVVDDGSTDQTVDVVQRNSKVRLIRQENHGLAAARNAGWRASTSDLLVFLDADDLLLPAMLECGDREMALHPECAFTSGQHRRFWGERSSARVIGPWVVARDHYLELLRGNYIGMHATVMYRRSVLEETRGFDETLRAVEDYDLYLRIARDHPVCCYGEIVADYRIHDANMSGDVAMMYATVVKVLSKQRPFVVGDPAREAAYRAGLQSWWVHYLGRMWDDLRHSPKLIVQPRTVRSFNVLFSNRPELRSIIGKRRLKSIARKPIRRLRKRLTQRAVGRVRFGDLRRTRPISDKFGFDRGLPVDRAYIERFLGRHAQDVRGRVLEIGDNAYTMQFGSGRVTRSDVHHVESGNPTAVFVGDLAGENNLPSDAFDCAIITQTLHLIFDLPAAIKTLHRVLKPGGVVLATSPGISQIASDQWGALWHWSLTSVSARKLFEQAFPAEHVAIDAYGNVLSAISFLEGLAASELRQDELDARDPSYEVIIGVRAVKGGPAS